MKIGILALQGSVVEHRQMLEKLGVEIREVRLPEDMNEIDGIILPGGESTTQSKLLHRFGLFALLQERIRNGLPVWGTCAGAILLATEVTGKNPPKSLAVMDIRADRNFYGAQLDSFEADVAVEFPEDGKASTSGVFIRAPKLEPLSDAVRVLAVHEGIPVMLQQGNMLVTAFHPELTEHSLVHEYFVRMCEQ